MKKSHILGILFCISFLLVMAGCASKEAAPTTPADTQNSTETPEAEEPELPTEGVASAGPDVTAETLENKSADIESETVATTEETAEANDTTTELGGEITSDEPGEENAPEIRVISLKDLKVYPQETHIKVGTTVEWRNINDKLQHIIGWNGQKSAGIKPEPMKEGESWSYTFTSPGKITWFSTAKPTVQGVIYVEE